MEQVCSSVCSLPLLYTTVDEVDRAGAEAAEEAPAELLLRSLRTRSDSRPWGTEKKQRQRVA